MYGNTEGKLRGASLAVLWGGIIASILVSWRLHAGIYEIATLGGELREYYDSSNLTFACVVLACLGIFASWVSSLTLYALGELSEKVGGIAAKQAESMSYAPPLGAEAREARPDRRPVRQCDGCGEQKRVNKVARDGDERWLCDDCHQKTYGFVPKRP